MNIKINDLDALKVSKYAETSTNYDGHCLRAYSYFREELPLIRLAEPTEKCYKAILEDGSSVYFNDSDEIEYNGKLFSGRDFATTCLKKEE